MAVRSWIEVNNFRRGGAVLRFSDMPEARTCYNMSPGGTAAISLTPIARCKFESPDDVDEAIADAISEALAELSGKAGTYCAGEKCFSASGFGSATVDGNNASCRISAGQSYQQWDVLCDPLGQQPLGSGGGLFTLEVDGPGKPGIDLTPLLESVEIDSVPGMDAPYRNAVKKYIADMLEHVCLIATPSFVSGTFGTLTFTASPPGYPNAGTITVYYSDDILRIEITVPSGVPGFSGIDTQVQIFASLQYAGGNWMSGGTASGSGWWGLDGMPPLVIWEVSNDIADGVVPSVMSFKNDDDPPHVSLTGVPFVYPSGTWGWAFDEVGAGGGGNYFQGSGSFGLNPVLEFPVVYNTPDCMVNLYYKPRHDFLVKKSVMCVTIFELDITPDTFWPKNHTPVCTIPVFGINYTPPV